jgi:hypothetical protein
MITKITKDLFYYIMDELQKNNNIEKIQLQIIEPLMQYTFSKLYPYILVTSIVFFLIFIIGLIVLILLIKLVCFTPSIDTGLF